MNSKIAVLCILALTQVDAHKLVQQEQGIFSKMIALEEADKAGDREIDDARKYKAQQMIDAEKEHQVLVEQEEKENAEEDAKKQVEYEERMAEKKRNDQIKHHQELFEEVMNQSNVQLLQFDDPEKNSVADIIGSGSSFVQLKDIERNSVDDIIGSASALNNQDLLQMYMEKEESEQNSPQDMIGSGPEYIGYLDISDNVKKITEQDKATMYAVAAATHTKVPEIAKQKVVKPIQKAQVVSASTLQSKASVEAGILKEDKAEIGTTKEEIMAVAKKLQVYMTPAMLMKDSDTEVAGALIDKAMKEGHSREEVELAMRSFNRAE